MSQRPPFVVRSSDVAENEASYPPPFDAEKLSLGRDLGRAAGSRSLGTWRERLAPGRRTSFTHAHLREEEAVFVLAGRPTLRWIPVGGEVRETELSTGDFVSFCAGTGIAHTFVNRADVDADLLVFGERRPGERSAYPEDTDFQSWRDVQRPHRAWPDANGPVGAGSWPPYRVETQRLVLRPWGPDDAPDLVAAIQRNQAHLSTYMPWAVEVPSLQQMLDRCREFRSNFDTDKDWIFGVYDLEGRLVGGTGLHDRVGPGSREIGYWVDAESQGRGLVTEWVGALTRLCFEVLKLDRVEIRCEPTNVRSAAVPPRVGFRHEGTLERRITAVDGGLRDAMVFVRFASDYLASPIPTEVRAWDGAGRRLL